MVEPTMTPAEQRQEGANRDLESAIDSYGFDVVLCALVHACVMKADHLTTNWQDKGAAAVWNHRANRLNTLNGQLAAFARDRGYQA